MKISRPWMKTRQPCQWKRTQHQMPIPFLPFEPPKYLQRASPTATTNSSLLRLLLQLLLLILLLQLLLLLLPLHFSNQDISDPSLFPPGSYSQHLYPFSREPLFKPPNLFKEKLGFQVQHLRPSPPPSFSFCLAISVHFKAKAVKGLKIAVCRNMKNFKIKILNHTCCKSYNVDIALLMLIVIAVQHHYCTFSTWLWCTIFMFPKNCDIISFRRPFSGQFFQVFNFENLKKLQICLVYCTALLLTSLERRESWSLILRPPWGPDLMFINANTNHAISARLFHFTWWRGVRSRGLCNWRPPLWTHFKWQNISIHHQNVNFTHFLMKWLILGTTFWKHVKKWQL